MSQNDLEEWIKNNMTIDDKSVIDAHREVISKLIGITNNGKVVLKVPKNGLRSSDLISLCLIGKFLGKVAGYLKTPNARNQDIASEMGIPEGTVGRVVTELEKRGMIKRSENGGYEIVLSSLPSILSQIKVN